MDDREKMKAESISLLEIKRRLSKSGTKHLSKIKQKKIRLYLSIKEEL